MKKLLFLLGSSLILLISNNSFSQCVGDVTPPVATCMGVTAYLDAAGTVTIDSNALDNGSTDNCGIQSITLSQETFTCADIGVPVNVTMTVTDTAGNIATCSGGVTVLDTISPTATCQNITIYLNGAGTASISATDINNGSSDICGLAALSITPSSFNCTQIGTRTVTLTATDISGNTSTCTSTVTILDTISPTASCQNITVFLDGAGTASIVAGDIDNGSSDACGIASLAADITAFTCADLGSNTVTLTVTDGSGNTSTCTSTVTVSDTTSPTVSCQNITVFLDGAGTASIVAGDIDNGSTDNCTSVTLAADITAFTCADLGANTVTLTVTDGSGNISTCTSTVTVSDTTSPTATCQNVTVYLDAAGTASLVAGDIDNGSTDNCTTVTLAADITSFTCAELGANTVTLTVTDGSGNTSTCTSTVTVLDTIAPMAMCQDTTVYLDATGSVTIDSSYVDGGSTDNCSIETITLSATTFTCDSAGVRMVMVTVTDSSGNVDSCMSMVTVLDTIAPMAMCQDTTVYLDATGSVTIDSSYIDNGSTDNCSIETITLSETNFTCDSVGVRMVMMYVTDSSGNVDSCISMVTVLDTIPPTVLCKNTSLFLDSMGNATIVLSDVENGNSDNCGIDTVYILEDTLTCANLGTNNISVIAVDVNGNIDSCIAIVTVSDIITPFISCKPDTLYLTGTAADTLNPMNLVDSVWDNCSFTVTATPSIFNCTNIGVNSINIVVTDGDGRSSNCFANLTVLDSIAPVAMCKDTTVYLDATGSVTIDSSYLDNGSTDNCGIATISLSSTVFSCDSAGARTVSVIVTDNSGNVDTCTSIVTVLDTIAPIAMCQDITVYLDATGSVSIDSSDVDNGSTDNCKVVTIAISDTLFDCSQVGPNVVTVIVTDSSGNVDSCISTVTVLDTINPVVFCQDTTISLDTNNVFTIDSSYVFSSASDNCGIDSVWFSKSMFTCRDLGPNSITVYASDSSGNIDSCTSIVTINIVGQPANDTIAVQINSSNFAQICLTDNRLLGTPTSYTNCKMVTRGNLINYNDTCFTYTQTSGTKYLDTACVIICDDCGICDTTLLIFVPTPDSDTLLVGPVVPVSNVDTCVTLESTYMTGHFVSTCDSTLTSNGGIPVTITGLCVRYPVPAPIFTGDTACIIVCDTIHNISICDTTLIVYLPDVTSPTIICKGDTVYLNSFGTVTIDTSNVMDTVFDNTLINAVWLTPTSFNCANVGPNMVRVYARDTNRNMDSCMSTVTVLDTLSPIAICQNITIQLDTNGVASILAANVDGGSTDNCAIASIVIDRTNFDCSDLGMNNVVLTVTDIYGNSSTCTSIVTVEDNIAPEIACREDIQYVVRNTTCEFIIPNYIGEATAIDNCTSDSITYSQSPIAGSPVTLGSRDTTITITAVDASGNSSSCSFVISARCVKELNIPQFISPDGNGQNDTWELPELINYPNSVVKVYNRWGNLVFEEKGYYTGWDATPNVSTGANLLMDNKMLPEGTYFYIIDLGDNNFEPYTGYIQIKR